MERFRIVLPSILLVSLYFTEVYSAQSVSTPRPSATSTCSVAEKFPCPQCNKKLTRKSNVALHVRAVHKGIKPFACTQCNKNFSRKSNLTRHVRAVHKGIKPFACTQCNKKLTRRSNLTRHVRAAHEGNQCTHGKGKFLQNGLLDALVRLCEEKLSR